MTRKAHAENRADAAVAGAARASIESGEPVVLWDHVTAGASGQEPGPCLYHSPARGPARRAELDEWRAACGGFGSLRRSHAWHLTAGPVTSGGWPARTARCRAAVLMADGRPAEAGCGGHLPDRAWRLPALAGLVYRGCCLGCEWEGAVTHDCENAAADDALDHAWPGWRDLPVVSRPATTGRDDVAKAAWLRDLGGVLPGGWLEAGGPIRTMRSPQGFRSVPASTPWGGYDAAVNWRALIRPAVRT
jgi:Family of unknown function (DUF6349)